MLDIGYGSVKKMANAACAGDAKVVFGSVNFPIRYAAYQQGGNSAGNT
jgi:hypothetical protein